MSTISQHPAQPSALSAPGDTNPSPRGGARDAPLGAHGQIRPALAALLRRPAPSPGADPGTSPATSPAPSPTRQSLPEPAAERGNLVLQALDAAPRAALEPCLERVALTGGEVLQERGVRPAHVIFPVSGAVSLEAGGGKQRLQVALVGREGLVGASLLLDGQAAHTAVVQFAGAGWRAPADALAERLEQHPELHRQLLRGINGFIARLSLTALANGRGTIEQRLARWLLTAAERLDGDLLAITHESLSHALGVRRAGVTVALHVLEGKGALRSERRRIRLLDREKLIAAAGPYGPPTI